MRGRPDRDRENKKLREIFGRRLGLLQAQKQEKDVVLAEIMMVDVTLIRAYKTARWMPSMASLMSLANTYGLTLDWFFEDK